MWDFKVHGAKQFRVALYKANRKCTFSTFFGGRFFFIKVSKLLKECIYIFMIMILKLLGFVKNVASA